MRDWCRSGLLEWQSRSRARLNRLCAPILVRCLKTCTATSRAVGASRSRAWSGCAFAINVLTRLRVCTSDGEVDLKMKGKPPKGHATLQPWFEIGTRLSADTRVVFGHWSALGLVLRKDVVGLDSGCVWGGALTALDLDAERPAARSPVTIAGLG